MLMMRNSNFLLLPSIENAMVVQVCEKGLTTSKVAGFMHYVFPWELLPCTNVWTQLEIAMGLIGLFLPVP